MRMSYFGLMVSLGLLPGITAVTKYGRSINLDSGIETDIWDRANPTDDQTVWVAPTEARIHDIVSSNAGDAAAGVGARTVRIWGLKTWDLRETSENIVMNGLTDVPTVNAYVIIHRMRVVTAGATGPNIGKISATAQIDTTVTALMLEGNGSTEMTMLGIPSTQKAYVTRFFAGINFPSATASVNARLRENFDPENQNSFLVRHTFALDRGGTSQFSVNYSAPKIIEGPAIIKVTGTADVNNAITSAGFDAFIADNLLTQLTRTRLQDLS